MARKSFIQIGGVLYDKSQPFPDIGGEVRHGYTVMGDLPDFVSPVDGSIVSGRAGLREHNLRNNVVNTLDLAGLPPMAMNTDIRSSSEKRRDADHRNETIARQLYNR